jgi:[ribosomal protein S5]-alanine N-acetyltransferase
VLTGDVISLRPVSQADLDQLYRFHIDIRNRGDYFPLGIASETVFKRRFQETGLWSDAEGMLLIVDPATDAVLGHIEFFRTVNYLDELELSYQLYAREHDRKGVVTDAVRLLTAYLFDSKRFNRIRLIIHPDNAASRRVAEKCGFLHEGTARGAWFHQGRSHDVEVYAQTRADHDRNRSR